MLKAQSEYDGALAAYEDGLDVEKKLMANEPNYPLWQSNLAWTYTKAGGLLSSCRGESAKDTSTCRVPIRLTLRETVNPFAGRKKRKR